MFPSYRIASHRSVHNTAPAAFKMSRISQKSGSASSGMGWPPGYVARDKGVMPASFLVDVSSELDQQTHHVRIAVHDGVEERIHNFFAQVSGDVDVGASLDEESYHRKIFGINEPDVAHRGVHHVGAYFSRVNQGCDHASVAHPTSEGENGIDLKSGINQSAGDGDVIFARRLIFPPLVPNQSVIGSLMGTGEPQRTANFNAPGSGFTPMAKRPRVA